jgi:hypothetical protein
MNLLKEYGIHALAVALRGSQSRPGQADISNEKHGTTGGCFLYYYDVLRDTLTRCFRVFVDEIQQQNNSQTPMNAN